MKSKEVYTNIKKSLKYLEESVQNLEKVYKILKEKSENILTKEDKKDLIAFLEEYLKIFKNKKAHQKVHKKEPCMICHRARELLRKLKI